MHVLLSGEAPQQVVALNDHADPAAQAQPGRPTGIAQLLAEELHRPLLNLAEGTDQGEQGGFPAAGWARQQHHLPWIHPQADVLEHLAAHGTAAVAVPQTRHQNHRCHQKISAGSASPSLRMASTAEAMHMTRIMVNTVSARVVFIVTGSWVALRTSRYKPCPAA